MGQLAAKVRAKYPGVYDDLGDEDLEKRVLAKHPEYSDLAGPAPAKAEGPGLLQRGLSAVGDVVSGAVKEAPLVAMRAAQLPQDIVSGAASLVADKLGSPALQAADIKRNEAGNNFRRGVEAPLEQKPDEGRASKLGRIVSRSAPTAALAALTGGASLPAQAAILGSASGAQTVSEGGGAGDAALSAALGGAAPFVGAGISKATGVAGKGLRSMAVKQYERALGATKEGMKAEAARIAPELLDRGVKGTLKGLAGKATANVDDIGQQIQASYQAASKAGTRISGDQLANALEKLKTPFIEAGQGGKDVVLNPGAVKAVDDLQGILRELGDATPSAIWKFRKTVDDVVAASNGFTRELPGGTAREIQKQTRAILQKELNRAVPDVQALNSEFRLWKGLQDVTQATLKRRTSQENSLIPSILGGGAFSGLAATGSALAAAPAGAMTYALVQFVRSPIYRTTSAVTKNALADVLSGVSGAAKTTAGKNALNLLALFGAKGAHSQTSQPEDTGR
jgi:hypothetical protein